jgi:hypothetical protein
MRESSQEKISLFVAAAAMRAKAKNSYRHGFSPGTAKSAELPRIRSHQSSGKRLQMGSKNTHNEKEAPGSIIPTDHMMPAAPLQRRGLHP